MGWYPDNTGCTCDTPHGSEARLCSFCKEERNIIFKKPKKKKQKRKR